MASSERDYSKIDVSQQYCSGRLGTTKEKYAPVTSVASYRVQEDEMHGKNWEDLKLKVGEEGLSRFLSDVQWSWCSMVELEKYCVHFCDRVWKFLILKRNTATWNARDLMSSLTNSSFEFFTTFIRQRLHRQPSKPTEAVKLLIRRGNKLK